MARWQACGISMHTHVALASVCHLGLTYICDAHKPCLLLWEETTPATLTACLSTCNFLCAPVSLFWSGKTKFTCVYVYKIRKQHPMQWTKVALSWAVLWTAFSTKVKVSYKIIILSIFRASHCDKHQFHAKMMVKGKLYFCYHKLFPLTVFCEAFNQL